MADIKKVEEPSKKVPSPYEKLKIPIETAKGSFVHDFHVACLLYQDEPHFFIDCIVHVPPSAESVLVSRLIATPKTLKNFKRLLERVISDFEKDQGEIKLPPENIVHEEEEGEVSVQI
jgi:hypothetical protein